VLVSAAFHLHDQQPIPFPHDGKFVLDCRPLCSSSEDPIPFPLQLSCQNPLCGCFHKDLMSVKKKVHLLECGKN
jgi:hypothetical protein